MATAGPAATDSEMIENPAAEETPVAVGTPEKTSKGFRLASPSMPQVPDMFGHHLSDGHRLRKLGPKELVAVRRAFNDIDQDGSGQIDIIEVRTPPHRSALRSVLRS